MKKRYKIRHRILEELFKSAASEKYPQISKNKLSNIAISKLTGIAISDIDIYHELLHEEKEILCSFPLDENATLHAMLITTKGRQSYIDKKFLKEGRKEFWDNIYDPLKIILPIVSILVAGLALYLTKTSTNKIETLNKQLNGLKTEIDSFKKK